MSPGLRTVAVSLLTAVLVHGGGPAAAYVDRVDARVEKPEPRPEPEPAVSQVVAISIDGLNPRALVRLGRRGAPTLHGMIRSGASTLNARTAYELTVTLPNHTSMVTGRPIDPVAGGHGVTWNDERLVPATVQEAAGGPVESVFSTLAAAGLGTALFATKQKFSLWQRSWPAALDRFVVRVNDDLRTTRGARRDLRNSDRAFTFVHLGQPDVAGHAAGWMSDAYLDAVSAADANVGRILATLDRSGEADETLVILTSDHGGRGHSHSDPTAYADYRVPFLVVGPGVPARTDLYDLNPDYRDPDRRRPSYAQRRQPLRNGMVANLATDVLGISAVPGSRLDARQDLTVFGS